MKKLVISFVFAAIFFSAIGFSGCYVNNTPGGPQWVSPCPYSNPVDGIPGTVITLPNNSAPVITGIAVYSDAGLTNRIDVPTTINSGAARLVNIQYTETLTSTGKIFTPQYNKVWLKTTATDPEGDAIYYKWQKYASYAVIPQDAYNEQELIYGISPAVISTASTANLWFPAIGTIEPTADPVLKREFFFSTAGSAPNGGMQAVSQILEIRSLKSSTLITPTAQPTPAPPAKITPTPTPKKPKVATPAKTTTARAKGKAKII